MSPRHAFSAATLSLVVLAGGASFAVPTAATAAPATSWEGVALQGFAWGSNDSGELGNGTTVDDSVPGPIGAGAGPGTWTALAAGGDFSCGIGTDAAAYCWGGNGDGTLGNGTTNASDDDSLPAPVLGGAGSWRAIGGGWNFVCGLGTDSLAYCWGKNGNGQLGNGTTRDDSLPVLVLPGQNAGGTWDALSVDYGTVCGLRLATAYCWGYGSDGQLGNGTTADDSQPAIVLPGANSVGTWRAVDPGTGHTCGIATDGTGYCWGSNGAGQLGNGSRGSTDDSLPVAIVSGPATWKAIAAGEAFSCGIGSDDALYCWGQNNVGQLGNGTTDDTDVPVRVDLGGEPVLTVATSVGYQSVCATTASAVYCWGQNNQGQLGNGTQGGFATTPQLVIDTAFTGLSPATVSVGGTHVLLTAGIPPSPRPDPVLTPPSAPLDVTAAAGDRSVTATWAPPASPGSFLVTDYQAIAMPGGRSCVAAVPGLGCTITGLSNGTSYTVTVRALNGAGWGPHSAASDAVVPGPGATTPGAVRNLRVIAVEPGGATLRWRAPASDGGTPVTGYRVWARQKGTDSWVRIAPDATRRSIAVTELEPGARYRFRVAALNAAGRGPLARTSEWTPIPRTG